MIDQTENYFAERRSKLMGVFYVRGNVCEMIPTVVMVESENEYIAELDAVDCGLSGEVTVISKDEWEATGGLEEFENFIIGFEGA